MRALGDVVRGQPSLHRQDRPQRTGLQDLSAKVATQKRVEKHAERTPTVFDKYMSKQPPKQMEQQRTKEQSRDRERSAVAMCLNFMPCGQQAHGNREKKWTIMPAV